MCREQEAVQEAAAVRRAHPKELPGLLLAEEVPAPPLGGADFSEAGARPTSPPGLQAATGGEEEEGGGGAGGEPQEEAPAGRRGGAGEGEVGLFRRPDTRKPMSFLVCPLLYFFVLTDCGHILLVCVWSYPTYLAALPVSPAPVD